MRNKSLIDSDSFWVNDNRDFCGITGGKEYLLHNTGSIEVMMFNYSEKYIEAAYQITNNVMNENDISKLNTYFLPIAFLFRHSIELCLKASLFRFVVEKRGLTLLIILML